MGKIATKSESSKKTTSKATSSATKKQNKLETISQRIKDYETIKKEFYALNIDENTKIDKYIKMLMAFNDEFLDYTGELGLAQAVIEGGPGYIVPITQGDLQSFVNLALSFVGNNYIWGAWGHSTDASGKLTFDCSGLVLYCMIKCGFIPERSDRGSWCCATMANSGYFYKIPWDKKQYGDVLVRYDKAHTVIYLGNNQTVEAYNEERGVIRNKLEFNSGTALRIKGTGVE